MGECEKVLGGLPNLGKLSVVYEKYHHLLQLIEADAVLKAMYSNGYTSGEAKAFSDGAASVLDFLKRCHKEVQDKKVVLENE